MSTLLTLLDLAGVALFALSGVISAKPARLDIYGAVVIALMTALGGGTMRDLLLGRTPVFWIQDEIYLFVTIPAAVISFYVVRGQQPSRMLRRILLTLDALGLAVFAVIGAEIARVSGVSPVVSILMGVMTGTFGGMMRDIFLNQLPVVLHREIYALAALSGAFFYIALYGVLETELLTLLSVVLIFCVRIYSIRKRLTLPVLHE